MSNNKILFSFDVGGSNTRVKFNDEKARSFKTEFAIIPTDYSFIKEIAHPSEELIITFPSKEKIRLLKADAITAYATVSETVSPHMMKAKQPGTIYNICYAIARQSLNTQIGDKEIYIAQSLPPSELYGGHSAEYKKLLAGTYKVEFPYLNRNISFEIKEANIILAPEGIVCRNNLTISDRKTLAAAPALSVDIGYRSTDIAVLLKGKVTERSAKSSPHACVQAVEFIRTAMERAGIYCTDSEIIEDAIPTGYIQGKDITSIVNTARRQLLDMIFKKDIFAILSSADIPITAIKTIMLNGRVFNNDSCNTKLLNCVNYIANMFSDAICVLPNGGEFANVTSIYKVANSQWKLSTQSQDI